METVNALAALRAADALLKDSGSATASLVTETLSELDLENTTSTFAAALAGEYALKQAGLPALFDDERVSAYLTKTFNNNSVPSKPVPLMEADGGDVLPSNTFSFPAPLQAYSGSLALSLGLTDVGLEPYLRMFQIAYAAQKAPWKQALRYDVPAGAKASIRYHRVAMSAWSIWRTLSGAVHDVPAQRLYLNPQPLNGEGIDMEIPVFTPAFWGWLKYNEADSTGTLAVTHVFSDTTVTLSSIASGLNTDGSPKQLVPFTEPFVLEKDATLELAGWPNKPGGTVTPQKPQLPELDDEISTGSVSLDDKLTSTSADDTISTTTRDTEDGEEMAPTPEEPEFPEGVSEEG
jgi:hypothetical protein